MEALEEIDLFEYLSLLFWIAVNTNDMVAFHEALEWLIWSERIG